MLSFYQSVFLFTFLSFIITSECHLRNDLQDISVEESESMNVEKTGAPTRYLPTWESLDARPNPAWYDDVKFGIFIVWGVYSVPSFGNEWFWSNWVTGVPDIVKFMKDNYPPGFTYADFAAQFHAELYDPNAWADLIEASGAKYTAFTTKHHDGFTLWPSAVSFNWNSMDVGPKRDLTGELVAALRKRAPDVHIGLYHSMFEWYNRLYLQDQRNGYKTQDFVAAKALPELYEIVNAYLPDLIWSDGDWEAPYEYWNATQFIAWLYNDSPVRDTVVTNDRWGAGVQCKHGGFYTCQDRYNPGVLQKHKWENCMTIDAGSWGFRRNAALKDYLTIEELLKTLVETVSCGGNLLMNVGPTSDGRIIPIFEERLRQMGQWLKVNGEAIYSSKPWTHQNDTITKDIWYTSKIDLTVGKVVYVNVLTWPEDGVLILGAPLTTVDTAVTMLGYQGGAKFTWTAGAAGRGMTIQFPPIPFNKLPSTWAWVLKIVHLSN